MWPEVRRWLVRYRGRFWGAVSGLVLSVMVMRLGVVWTVFIAVTVLAGYFVGRYLEGDAGELGEILERLLPPGRR